jgi:hypothetical protein
VSELDLLESVLDAGESAVRKAARRLVTIGWAQIRIPDDTPLIGGSEYVISMHPVDQQRVATFGEATLNRDAPTMKTDAEKGLDVLGTLRRYR